jgi:hypothetical protein
MMSRPVQTVGSDSNQPETADQMTFDIDQIVQRWIFDPDLERRNHRIDNGSPKEYPNRRPRAKSAQTAGQPGEGL